jgi:hypothetical protein
MGNKRYFHYMRKSLKESTTDRSTVSAIYVLMSVSSYSYRLLHKIVGLPDNGRKAIVKLFTGAKLVLNH